MVTCRTIEEVIAAADADSEGEPPLSQAAADQVAAILLASGRWKASGAGQEGTAPEESQ
jgi:hypothetical protein